MDYQNLAQEFIVIKDENERTKFVYACFGLACYWIQCLEQTFENMIIIGTFQGKKNSLNEKYIDEFYLNLEKSKDTMGTLLKKVQAKYSISHEDVTELSEILVWRNKLVHGYFKKNSFNWYTSQGQLEMVDELSKFTWKVKKVDLALQKYFTDYLKEFGITDEFMKAKLEAKRKEELVKRKTE